MARIPIRTAGRSLDPGSPVQYPSSLPTGAAMAGFGQDLAAAGQRIQAADDEKLQRENALRERFQRETEATQAFQWDQEMRQFEIGLTNELPNFQAKTPASGLGLAKSGMEEFDRRSQDLLKAAPPHLQEKARALVDTQRVRFEGVFAEAELQQRRGWSEQTLNERLDDYRTTTFNDPSEVSFRAAQEAFIAQVDAAPGLTELEKADLKRKGVESLSDAAVLRDLQDRPDYVMGNLGVAAPPGTMNGRNLIRAVVGVESEGDPNAESEAGASGLMQVMPATGAEIARELGDANFPAGGSEAQQKAYLKREAVSLQYGSFYLDKMLRQYGGDLDAALVAYNGGPARADAWLAAGRDDSVIPKESADYKRKVRARLGQAAPAGGGGRARASGGASLPIVTDGHADLDGVKPVVMDMFGALQNQWGRALPISSGHRDAVYNKRVGGANKSQHIHGNALDVDVSKYSEAERVELIAMASAMGFTGIGVYKGSLHLDTGPRRAWGSSYGKESVPGWAKGAIDAHLAGQADGLVRGGVRAPAVQLDPRYAGLSFARRMELMGQAEREADQRASAAATQQKAEYGAYKDSLELSILTGDVTTETQILANETLTDGDKSTLLRTLRSQQETVNASSRALADYQAGGMRELNPLDSDERASADKAYGALMKSLGEASPEVAQQQTEAFVRETRIIPASVQADLRQGLASFDPARVATAAQQAAVIQAAAPLAFENMPGADQMARDLTTFRTLVDGRGYGASEAARELLERRKPEYQNSKKLWETEARKAADEIEPSAIASAVSAEFDTWAFGDEPAPPIDPDTSNALTVQYREIYTEEFVEANGKADVAAANTARILKKTWGVTSLSGERRLMQYAPERTYPPIEGGWDYLREEAMTTAREFAGEGAEVDNVYLVPALDPQTRRNLTAEDLAAGRPARYMVGFSRKVDGIETFEVAPLTWAVTPEIMKSRMDAGRQARQTRAEELRATADARENTPFTGSFFGASLSAPSNVEQRAIIRRTLGLGGGEPAGGGGNVGAYRAPPNARPATAYRDLPADAPMLQDPRSRFGIEQRLKDRMQEMRSNAVR